MKNNSYDPAQALVDAVVRATAVNPPFYVYTWKLVGIIAIASSIVAAIAHLFGVNGLSIGVSLLIAGVMVYMLMRVYYISRSRFYTVRTHALLVKADIVSSVSLRQWPMCYDALVRAEVVVYNEEYSVRLDQGPIQVEAMTAYLVHSMPVERPFKNTGQSFSDVDIVHAKTTLFDNAQIYKKDYLKLYEPCNA